MATYEEMIFKEIFDVLANNGMICAKWQLATERDRERIEEYARASITPYINQLGEE